MRRAEVGDAAILARVHVDAWRAAYGGLVPDEALRRFDYAGREESFRDALAAGAEETYVIEVARAPVGFVTIGSARDVDVDVTQVGEVWGIYIAPAQWRRGIGTLAMAQGEEMLRSRGLCEAVLWVLEGNDQGRRFYEAAGYTLDGGTKPVEWGRPLIAVRYRKALKRS
jgi:ribosomal protein S18 acetylase RimI-like enzyme